MLKFILMSRLANWIVKIAYKIREKQFEQSGFNLFVDNINHDSTISLQEKNPHSQKHHCPIQ